jgi:hypothetical protein
VAAQDGATAPTKRGHVKPAIIASVRYLEDLAKASVETCRVKSNEAVHSPSLGISRNTLGIDAILPASKRGAEVVYPAFWLRDFVMSAPSGLLSAKYLHEAAVLFAKSQKHEDWREYHFVVPAFTPAEHIRMDGGHCYFPGSYDTGRNQGGVWGQRPPMDSSLYFVHLVYYAFERNGTRFLQEKVDGVSMIDRATRAFYAVEFDAKTDLCKTTPATRAVGFGFADTVHMVGHLLFASCLRYRAAEQLAAMHDALGMKPEAENFRRIAQNIKEHVPRVFRARGGFLYAATQVCRQRDVWGTAFAVYAGILSGEDRTNACLALKNAYLAGQATSDGYVRNILTNEDWCQGNAWEYEWDGSYGDYVNGGYWVMATGHYMYALAQVDPALSQKLFLEMIAHFKHTDFRTSAKYQGPYEWYNPSAKRYGAPVNLVSAACPLEAVQRIVAEGLWNE